MGRSDSKPVAPVVNPEFEKPWRNFNWDQKSALKEKLRNFTLCKEDVPYIKIMVAGQIGAGKSSFINSVNNVFEGRITSRAQANSSACGTSFTKAVALLPFAFLDIMGLEPEILAGALPDDIVKAVFGHVKDGYKFDEKNPVSPDDQHYTSDPSFSDQAFCLIYVISADTVQFTDDKLIDKLSIVRHRVSENGIPQVIIMTKVDEACPLVNKDLRKIYTSRKIKEKMQTCSDRIGVPMANIFPVKNYHGSEVEKQACQKRKISCLMKNRQ